MKALVSQAGAMARAAESAEAVAASEVLVLATPWEATQKIVEGLGDLKGKVLIDAVNPLLPNLAGLATGGNTSGGELVAQWARGARVVKCFNTVGANVMANAAFSGMKPAMLYCGDDAEAKSTAKQLAGELGFDPLDAGPLTRARLLEPLAMLWITLAYPQGFGHDIAFALLRR
jgi:8-hydroxy-5-deazaflavin:NADPH oxidoreductase